MKRLVLILTTLVLLCTITGLQAIKTYSTHHSDTGYSVEYPDTWQYADERAISFEIIPVTVEETDTIPSISVTVKRLDKTLADLSFADFNKKILEQFHADLLASGFMNPQTDEPYVSEVSGVPSMETYTRTVFQGAPWRLRQIVVRKGNNIYIMTCYATKGSYEKWLTDFIIIESGFSLD